MTTILAGSGILLRKAESADCEALLATILESKDDVGRWMSWCHPDYGRREAEEWIARCQVLWADEAGERDFAIFDAVSGEVLGCAGLNQFNRVNNFANLGYWVRSSRSRRGVATAAASLVAHYGFVELGFARIEIVAQVDNVASRRVAEKVGARLEGIARNRLLFRGEPRDAALYSLVPADVAAGNSTIP